MITALLGLALCAFFALSAVFMVLYFLKGGSDKNKVKADMTTLYKTYIKDDTKVKCLVDKQSDGQDAQQLAALLGAECAVAAAVSGAGLPAPCVRYLGNSDKNYPVWLKGCNIPLPSLPTSMKR